jgi:uncharacterized membrane protein
MNRIPIWPTIIVVSTFDTLALELAGVHSIVRALVAFWFLLLCPGLAIVRPLRLGDRTGELMVAIGVSLALETLLAAAALYAGVWSPLGILLALSLITLAGAAVQWQQDRAVATAGQGA